jgi:hypothetical protein
MCTEVFLYYERCGCAWDGESHKFCCHQDSDLFDRDCPAYKKETEMIDRGCPKHDLAAYGKE